MTTSSTIDNNNTSQEKNRNPNAKFLDTMCPSCGDGNLIETPCMNIWWVVCNECDHHVFCYEPMPHQLRYHMDPAKFKMFAGGSKVLCPL